MGKLFFMSYRMLMNHQIFIAQTYYFTVTFML